MLDIDYLLDNLAFASQDRLFLEGGIYRELVLRNVIRPLQNHFNLLLDAVSASARDASQSQ